MNYKITSINRFLAFFIGIALPLGETVRLYSGSPGYWAFWLNDYLLSLFLLYAVWQDKRDYHRGQKMLIAAWALSCGMFYMSFFSHIVRQRSPFAPTGKIPNWAHTVVAGVCFAITIIGMVLSLMTVENRKSSVEALSQKR